MTPRDRNSHASAAHLTPMLVTFAEATVPVPADTWQVCPLGLRSEERRVGKECRSRGAQVNSKIKMTIRSSPPLSCNTTVPDNPDTVPPTEYVLGSGGG